MAEYAEGPDKGGSAKAPETDAPSKLDAVELCALLKSWWNLDMPHCAEWHKQARENFDFYPGRGQWTEDERNNLETQKRAPIVFNRVLPMIKAVAGVEINSRHEVIFLPRSGPLDERGTVQVKANETLSAASRWMDDTSDAEDHQSAAFQDVLKVGMGWSEPRVSYDDDPKGSYVEERVSPLEMFWDYRARAKNLTDRQRHWRVKKMLRSDAKALFPNAADDDLNCAWVLGANERAPKSLDQQRRNPAETVEPEDDPQSEVTILQVQWWEYEKGWLVAVPESPDEPIEMTDSDFTEYRKKAEDVEKRAAEVGALDENGQPIRIRYSAAKMRRKVYRQAFIGRTILGDVKPPQDPKGFTLHCITGEIDETKGHFFGLIDIARDPQRFANLVLSQTAHILNSTAKGGIIAERDAFEDQRQAEATYARPDAITWAAQGAIAKGKIMAKPGAGIAAGHGQLLDFAISSIRDVLGINLEILGLRDANQPGILEAQRKQAAMTILATLFDSLRRFRKLIGRTRLAYIQRYLADGRMVRISGQDGHKLVQLLKQQVIGEYEVVISDAPTSPNQKQETWAILQGILPLFRDMMTPEVAVLVLEFSPLPSQLVDKLKELAGKPPPPELQQRQQAEQRALEAKTAKDEAGAVASRAGAVLDLANAAATKMQTQLQQAEAAIAAALVAQQPAPMPADAPMLEPLGPTAPQPMPQLPPPMPAPAEMPMPPELPVETPGATDRVL